MLELALTPDARLRLLEERDADELYALVEANRSYLKPWMPWAAAEDSPEKTLEFVRTTRRQLADNDGIQTAIVVDGRIAGCVGLNSISWADSRTEIGYWLAEKYQGRGLMTVAVRAHVDHAFHGYGLNRVELRAALTNTRSQALAERLGFTREGVLRQAETVGEHRHDLAVYAMLAADWGG